MRNFTLILLLFLGANIFGQTDSILFIGNSYTYTQDVPGKFKSLAESAGKSVYVTSQTGGGLQLSDHLTRTATTNAINSANWDFVVLQEQSQMPAYYPNTTISNAQNIAINQVKANNECTEIITYMTWARAEGNSWLTQINWTHDQMATYYEDFYEDIWQYVPGRVSPVGAAFHQATREGINVYSSDLSHQNEMGSYLAACVFYATIYKTTPVGLSYKVGDNTTAERCQEIAAEIVLEDLYFYNINKVQFTISDPTINVGETIDFAESVYVYPFPPTFSWNFEGAETTSSNSDQPSGIHYNSAGTFDVSLTISDNCAYQETRVFSDTIVVSPVTSTSEISNNNTQPYFSAGILIMPNNLSIEKVVDVNGKIVTFTQTEQEVFGLFAKGLYILTTSDGSTFKIINK